jgi:hypothetical protein
MIIGKVTGRRLKNLIVGFELSDHLTPAMRHPYISRSRWTQGFRSDNSKPTIKFFNLLPVTFPMIINTLVQNHYFEVIIGLGFANLKNFKHTVQTVI